MYEINYHIADIIEVLAAHREGLKPSQIQRLCRASLGMSTSTFWRLWKETKDHPSIISMFGNFSWREGHPIPERPEPEPYSPSPNQKAHNNKQRSLHNTPAKKAARKMPPLYHKHPDEEFDCKKSQALQWLLDQPDILNSLWNKYSHSSLIFNQDTRLWQGKDYQENNSI